MSFTSKSALALVLASVPGMAATSCEGLASLNLPDATITSVQSVAAGAFTPPNDNGRANYKDLPAFCRVMATLKPSSDSDIKVEVWLPSADWNKKYQAVGNGGWAGVISYSELADALRGGYATSSTDTGHVGGSGSFALGHPEKLTDFAWRSEHEMTVKSKALIEAFYGAAPRLSYWNGCSTGGRQGLKEAQQFPADYDAIIAGAPANRTALALWVASAMRKDTPGYLPPAKLAILHQAAVDACDAQDGLKDGLIGNPAKCKFDPKVIECKGGDGPNCLTGAQVEAVRKIYSNGTNPRTGQTLFPTFAVGSELGWNAEPSANIVDQYKYVAFKNPSWDWQTFDFDKDIAASEKPEYLVMNATDPNLSKFFGHNGKLLLYHGWADTNVSPYLTIQYYKSVVDTMGGEKKASDSVRLFLEPGMGHCGGGVGPNKFDKVGAMEAWVEKGTAPDKMIASHATAGKVDRTRPLCPYPQVAKYKGSGSIDEAANFTCVAGL
ncbi:MAG: tannase/feruloyl esterase family alpha/beta hydrolase [Bryobacteraceae bacterium]|jgi:feruloyl esterase